MTKSFKRGDRVEWNSEAGRGRGVIVKKIVSDVRFKGYVHHASKGEPQYIIKSEKTDHSNSQGTSAETGQGANSENSGETDEGLLSLTV